MATPEPNIDLLALRAAYDFKDYKSIGINNVREVYKIRVDLESAHTTLVNVLGSTTGLLK